MATTDTAVAPVERATDYHYELIKDTLVKQGKLPEGFETARVKASMESNGEWRRAAYGVMRDAGEWDMGSDDDLEEFFTGVRPAAASDGGGADEPADGGRTSRADEQATDEAPIQTAQRANSTLASAEGPVTDEEIVAADAAIEAEQARGTLPAGHPAATDQPDTGRTARASVQAEAQRVAPAKPQARTNDRVVVMRRGGQDFEVLESEVKKAGGFAAWAETHRGAPVRVYMRDRKGGLHHVAASHVEQFAKQGWHQESRAYNPPTQRQVERGLRKAEATQQAMAQQNEMVKESITTRQEAAAVGAPQNFGPSVAPKRDDSYERARAEYAMHKAAERDKAYADAMDAAVGGAWEAAERAEKENLKQVDESHYGIFDGSGFDPAGNPVGGRDHFGRAMAHKKAFNLQTMAHSIFAGLPEGMKSERIGMYEEYYTLHDEELKGRTVEKAAHDALLAEVYQQVYNRAVEANMPRSKTEFLLRKVTEFQPLSPAFAAEVAASALTDSWDEQQAVSDAMSIYGQEHPVLDTAGLIGNMAVDVPTMWVSGGVGGIAAKASARVAGKAVTRQAGKKVAREVAERYAMTRLAGRMAGRMAHGAGNIGAYEGFKDVQRQLFFGGTLDPTTGERDGYSIASIFESVGRGVLLGSAMGASTTLIGNVGDKVVTRAATATGKAVTRTGQYLVSALAEGTIFYSPEWLESGQWDWGAWGHSMGTVMGFRIKDMPKTAAQALDALKGDRRMTLPERVKANLDKSSEGMRITTEEQAEMRHLGYGDLYDMMTCRPEAHDIEGRVTLRDDRMAGYDEARRFVEDGRVPATVRAKVHFLITGQRLPMPAVMGCAVTEHPDGTATVTTTDSRGGVVTRKTYGNAEAAERARGDAMRQVELNIIDAGEQAMDVMAVVDATAAARDQVAAARKISLEDVQRILRTAEEGGALDEFESVIAGEVSDAATALRVQGPNSVKARVEIGRRHGVSIDDAVSKPEGKRSEAERAAMEEYVAEMQAATEQLRERAGAKDVAGELRSDVAGISDKSDASTEGISEYKPALSATEKDERGYPFVVSSDGSTTFGSVAEESGLTAAPIRLSLGENRLDEDGRNRGYGLLHIEAGHGKQIREAGFSSVEEFVESVARNYETIREGNRYGDKATYLLEVSDGYNNTLFVELSNDGRYWNVNSAGIFRKRYSRRKPIVTSLPTIGSNSGTEAAEVNHGQNKGATVTSGNSSMTTGSKGNILPSEKQAVGEKSLPAHLRPKDLGDTDRRAALVGPDGKILVVTVGRGKNGEAVIRSAEGDLPIDSDTWPQLYANAAEARKAVIGRRVAAENSARPREDAASEREIADEAAMAGIAEREAYDEHLESRYPKPPTTEELRGPLKRKREGKEKSSPETEVLPEVGDQPSAISSEDGAKILKSLESFIQDSTNFDNTEGQNAVRNFIGNLASALGIPANGRSSRYKTFITRNGVEIRVRLSNHPATVKNFDDAGFGYGLSIIVDGREYTGLNKGGEARVEEYYYNTYKLRRAGVDNLSKIVRSLQQALYSGEYKDTTGLAEHDSANSIGELRRVRSEATSGRTGRASLHAEAERRVAEVSARTGAKVRVDRTIEGKGEFDPATGEVRVNPDAHETVEDMERTIMHELTGHGGVMALLGERFDSVCEKVYNLIPVPEMARLRRTYPDAGKAELGAEWMARLAENPRRDPTLWERATGSVRLWLQQRGFGSVTDADIRYMLWRAGRNEAKGRTGQMISRATARRNAAIEARLADAARRSDADAELMGPLRRAITPDEVKFIRRGLKDLGIVADTKEGRELIAAVREAVALSTWRQQLYTGAFDRLDPMRRLIGRMEGIKADKNFDKNFAALYGADADPMLNCERAASRAATAYQEFAGGELRAMTGARAALTEIAKSEYRVDSHESAEALARVYMIAKIGLERQERRSGGAATDVDYGGLTGAGIWMGGLMKRHGGRDLKPIDWEAEALNRGKRGPHELTMGEVETALRREGYPTLEEFVSGMEAKAPEATKALWDAARSASAKMLTAKAENGQLSGTSYQRLRYGSTFREKLAALGIDPGVIDVDRMLRPEELVDEGLIDDVSELGDMNPYYRHYMPLKGDMSELGELGGITSRSKGWRSLAGRIRGVKGHANMVDDPIAQLAKDYRSGMMTAYDNAWRRDLGRLIEQHMERHRATGEKLQAAVLDASQPLDADTVTELTGLEGESAISRERLAEIAKEGGGIYYDNGRMKIIYTPDKAVGEALNPDVRYDSRVARQIRRLNRFTSSASTSWNPAFLVSNFFRDVNTQMENTFIRNLPKGAAKLGSRQARKAFTRVLRGDFSGTGEWDRYAQEYMRSGAKVSGMKMESRDVFETERRRVERDISGTRTLADRAMRMGEALGRINDLVENRARFFTFAAMRKAGKSVAESAHAAKESTVNFDRRGAWAPHYFWVQMFLNPSWQGARRQIELARENPWRFVGYRVMRSGVTRVGEMMLGYGLYNLMSDDDRHLSFEEYVRLYMSVNDHTRMSNDIIPLGEYGTIKIPASMDDRLWNRLTDIVVKQMVVPDAKRDLAADAADMVRAVADMAGFEPLSRALDVALEGDKYNWWWVLGSNPALAPIVHAQGNTNFMGSRIRKGEMPGAPKPGHQLDFDKNQGRWWNKVARGINNLTGGDDVKPGFISPSGATLEQLATGYTGGVGSDTGKGIGLVCDLLEFAMGSESRFDGMTPREVVTDVCVSMPMLNRLVGRSVDSYAESDIRGRAAGQGRKGEEFVRYCKEYIKSGDGAGLARHIAGEPLAGELMTAYERKRIADAAKKGDCGEWVAGYLADLDRSTWETGNNRATTAREACMIATLCNIAGEVLSEKRDLNRTEQEIVWIWARYVKGGKRAKLLKNNDRRGLDYNDERLVKDWHDLTERTPEAILEKLFNNNPRQ